MVAFAQFKALRQVGEVLEAREDGFTPSLHGPDESIIESV